MNVVVAGFVVFTVLFSGCKTNDFNASSPAPATTPKPSPSDVPVATAAPSPLPSGCSGDGVSQVKLLTTSIQAGAPNQFVDFEIQWTDCNGNPKAISNANLKFDINAYSDLYTGPVVKPIPYTVSLSDGSSDAISDMFQGVIGSDLFGSNNTTYCHWEAKPLTYVPKAATIRLRLDLSNHQFSAQASTAGAKTSVAFPMPMFLRLGDAAPVQQSITVTP